MTNMWGIHNNVLTSELIDDGFISIGWDELGDMSKIGTTREEFKAALAQAHPDKKPMTHAVWAGTLVRFLYEMQVGDIVVAPYRPDSTINIGVITSEARFVPNAQIHRTRRSVEWKKVGVPRTVFTQPALNEIGSLLAVFGIKKHDQEFRAVLAQSSESEYADAIQKIAPVADAEEAIEEEPRASRIDRHTRDYLLKALKSELSHQEFEDFTADLLRGLGYQARVTAYSQDGGVDVIAHRDALGIEPPLIKVQCKQITTSIGAPEVNQLVGTLGMEERGLFVALGNFSKEARAIERSRPNLRLITGEDLVGLLLQVYAELPQIWRTRLPLTRVWVVDDTADHG